MSGTSLDGIDLAHINFSKKDNVWHFEILETKTEPYPENWLAILKSAIGYSETELVQTNIDYTKYLAIVITNFINQNNIASIDAVCSHGHTVLHQPQNGFTLQIGNLPLLSTLINQNVVCDFRVQDVQMGGQGAPLVPIGDQILFNDFDYCLNLGGFSNVSFQNNQKRIAFDISPVNTVLNFYANQLGFEYDDKGKLASVGKLNNELLSELNQIDFYSKNYPKSLGFEFVRDAIFPLIEKYPIAINDKLNTFVEHIAFQISKALPTKTGKMLLTGGGVYNDYLIERMQYYLPKMELIKPDSKLIEFKEALIFGLLGVLKIRNEINVLSSVTGATEDHSSGSVFLIK